MMTVVLLYLLACWAVLGPVFAYAAGFRSGHTEGLVEQLYTEMQDTR